jgi:hypothetical protein
MMDRHLSSSRIETVTELTEFDHLPHLPAIDNHWQCGITPSNEYCLYGSTACMEVLSVWRFYLYGAEMDDIRISYMMTDDCS